MNNHLLIIGIDGGTWSVLKPALKNGFMPFLQSLVDKGASGILKSTIPAITPAAWGVFQTGVNPGKTGIHDFFKWDKKSHEREFVQSSHLGLTLWDHLSRAGIRHAVINLPLTYPPYPINGYMVTGIFTPSLQSEFTSPPELKAKLLKEIPDYDILNLERAEREASGFQFESYVQTMAHMVNVRTRAAHYIMSLEPLQVMMLQYQATDALQHVLWNHLDPHHPLFDPQKQIYLFENFYRVLDNNIRDLYQHFQKISPSEPTLLVASDHGFQTHFKVFHIGRWLIENDYLKLRTPDDDPVFKKITKKLRVGKILQQFMSKSTVSQTEKKLFQSQRSPYNWEQSTAIARGGYCEASIYILENNNVQAEAIIQQLTAELYELKDPETNTPIVKNIYRKEELYHGKKTDILPDMIVVPADGFSFWGTYRNDLPLWQRIKPETDTHLGKHHSDGIIVAYGPGIKPTKNIHANIADITPTVLYHIGVSIKNYFDGNVIESIYTADFKNNITQRLFSLDKEGKKMESVNYSETEKKQLEDRLKDLGYL